MDVLVVIDMRRKPPPIDWAEVFRAVSSDEVAQEREDYRHERAWASAVVPVHKLVRNSCASSAPLREVSIASQREE